MILQPPSDTEFAPAYQQYLRDQWLRFSLISSAIAASLIPVFAVLDYFVYPEWFPVFLLMRVCCALIIIVSSLVVSRALRHLVKTVTAGMFLLIQAMILFMIAVTDGAQSTYYAGLNLTVIAIGLLLPTTAVETVAFCLATYVGYLIACSINQV